MYLLQCNITTNFIYLLQLYSSVLYYRCVLYLIAAGHELTAGRGTYRLHVVVLQAHALLRQFVKGRGFDLRLVVADVVVAVVVREDQHDVRLLGQTRDGSRKGTQHAQTQDCRQHRMQHGHVLSSLT
jgi:hypothetical protein